MVRLGTSNALLSRCCHFRRTQADQQAMNLSVKLFLVTVLSIMNLVIGLLLFSDVPPAWFNPLVGLALLISSPCFAAMIAIFGVDEQYLNPRRNDGSK